MAAWKQLALALVVAAVAVAAWIAYAPGAGDTLARMGITPPAWAAGAASKGEAQDEQAQVSQGGNRQGGARNGEGRRGQGGGQQPEVIAAAVTRAAINDTLGAIGTGQARASVTVNPFAAGRIVEIAVTPGGRVEAGDLLMRLDSDNEEIALDRAKLSVADAEEKLKRVQTLRNSRTATDVQVADARVVLSNARLAQRDAELALGRRAVRTPIAGIVGILPVELGAYVTSQTAIATIDDRSQIKIDFWVPERFASQIAVGQKVSAASVARPGEVIEGEISAVDNRLDQASRTMQVQAAIPNPDDRLRAGMSFQISMKFPGDVYPAVDPLAVQWSSDGAFVWRIKDRKALRTPVRIIQRNTETVLVDGELAEGDLVVTEGVHLVREGGEVRVSGEEPPPAPASIAPLAQGG